MNEETATTESNFEVDLRIIEQAKKDIANLDQLLADKQEALGVINAMIVTAEERLSKAKYDAEQSEARCDALDQDIKQSEDFLEGVKKDILIAEDTKRKVESELDTVKKNAASEIAAAKLEASNAKIALDQEINAEAVKLPPLKAEISKLERDADKAKVALDGLNASITTLEETKDKIQPVVDALIEDRDRLVFQSNTLKSELGVISNAIDSAKSDLKELNILKEDKLKELEESKAELTILEKQMFAFRKKVAVFEGRVAFVKEQFKHAGVPWPEFNMQEE